MQKPACPRSRPSPAPVVRPAPKLRPAIKTTALMAVFLMATRAIRNKLRPIRVNRDPIGHSRHKRTIRWPVSHKRSPSAAYLDAMACNQGIGHRGMTKKHPLSLFIKSHPIGPSIRGPTRSQTRSANPQTQSRVPQTHQAASQAWFKCASERYKKKPKRDKAHGSNPMIDNQYQLDHSQHGF